MTTQRHPRLTIVLHWAMAALLLGQLALGLWMMDLPKDSSGLRASWFNVHKSMGLMLLGLAAVRVAHLCVRRHLPPAHSPRWMQALARATHHLLYGLMVAVPLTGLLGSAWSNYPIRFFGLVLPRLAAPWEAGKAWMSQGHGVLTWLLMATVAAHLIGVAWHQLVLKDGLLSRMR